MHNYNNNYEMNDVKFIHMAMHAHLPSGQVNIGLLHVHVPVVLAHYPFHCVPCLHMHACG